MTDFPRQGSLLVIFLTIFIDLLGFGIVLPLLPIYADSFTLDESGLQLGLLMSIYSAMQFVFAPMWGRLSDRVGRRPVLIVGLGGSVAFYMLFAWATLQKSFTLLFVSRIGAGIAGATISTAQAYIADSTSLENRTKGMAIVGMAFGLGFTLGPLVGIAAVVGGDGNPGAWPGYIAAGLSAIALVMAIFVLPESLRPDSESASHRVMDFSSFRLAIGTPSIGPLLLAVFVCVFSFAKFETTLSMLVKGDKVELSPFRFSYTQVFLTFAFIGFVLILVQGAVVRRLSGRINEGVLAATGATLEVIGFLAITKSIYNQSAVLLFVSLGIIVAGFGLMTPSLNSLISRRSDPNNQGGILGIAQSVNSLGRILGSGIGIPLLKASITLPFFSAASLMTAGCVLVIWASRRGHDFEPEQQTNQTKADRA